MAGNRADPDTVMPDTVMPGGMKAGGGSGLAANSGGMKAGASGGGRLGRRALVVRGPCSGSASSGDPPAASVGGGDRSSGLPAKVWRIVPSASTARSIVPLMSKLRISLICLRTSWRLASRIMSSTWVWNSAAIRRAFLIIPVTAFMATGRSFGPMAIRATTPISTISDQAKSNMRARTPPGAGG